MRCYRIQLNLIDYVLSTFDWDLVRRIKRWSLWQNVIVVHIIHWQCCKFDSQKRVGIFTSKSSIGRRFGSGRNRKLKIIFQTTRRWMIFLSLLALLMLAASLSSNIPRAQASWIVQFQSVCMDASVHVIGKGFFFPALLNRHKKHLIPKINDPVPYSYAHISYRIMRMRMQMKEAEMLLSVSSCARIYIYNSSFSHSIPATLGLNLVMAIYWFTV